MLKKHHIMSMLDNEVKHERLWTMKDLKDHWLFKLKKKKITDSCLYSHVKELKMEMKST